MSRFWFKSLLFVGVLGAGMSALAQAPRNPAPTAAASSKFLMVPGLFPLSMQGVQREIGLSSVQRQQLKAVSANYVAARQRLDKSFREFSPEDQQSRAKEFSEQAAQIAHSAQHKAEAVLSPRQLQAVKRIAFQLSAAGALTNPELQEKVGLSEEQRQRLSAVYELAGEKMQQLQRETASQVMEVLADEQAAELKKLMAEQPKGE